MDIHRKIDRRGEGIKQEREEEGGNIIEAQRDIRFLSDTCDRVHEVA